MVSQTSHHKQWPVVGVSVIVQRDGCVLLARRGRPPLKGLWSLPGGKVETGERLAAAAAREVHEETGIAIDDLEPIDVAEIVDRDASKDVRSHYVVIVLEGIARSGTIRAGDDATEVRWVAQAELNGLALTEDTVRVLARHVGGRRTGSCADD